jgi:rRNA maturation RNase YbeY
LRIIAYYSDYLSVVVVHGVCHLLGHDHETPRQFKTMAKAERRALDAMSNE